MRVFFKKNIVELTAADRIDKKPEVLPVKLFVSLSSFL